MPSDGVSIPLRYADNCPAQRYSKACPGFQFLLGTLITFLGYIGTIGTNPVSIPLRYADNGVSRLYDYV